MSPVIKNTTDKAEGGTTHKTAPIQASSAIDAEFCDSPGAKTRFGLGRSYMYSLEKARLIRGVSLRKPGQLKGKKLWDVASIRRYLAAQMEGVR